MRATTPGPQTAGTSERILEEAGQLAQRRGFNGFSYADVAVALKITKASLHYHFASKAELGRALIVRYTERFQAALDALDGTPANVLRSYVRLYEDVLVRDRMCLCGMFAAEYSTLPGPMRNELRRFFEKNEAWLARHLEQGRENGALRYEGTPLEMARMLTAGLEGAMLLARSFEKPERFTETAERLLAELGVPRPRKRA